MCNVFCKEFRGWCKSFTRTEALLSILEAILLSVFVAFLTFLIMHYLACSEPEIRQVSIPPTEFPSFSSSVSKSTRTTLSADVQCTWKPSQKTAATTHYYEDGAPAAGAGSTPGSASADEPNPLRLEVPAATEDSDGEEVDEGAASFVLALVKIRPAHEPQFGCALTAVSRRWALTAASCVEAVEEADSLDAFAMCEGAGPWRGAAHAVAAVRVHPGYARAGRARDLAALRSDTPLGLGPLGAPRLPTVLDHSLVTIGERFSLLGYGKFRTPEETTAERHVRAAAVYSLPAEACEGEGPRHLARPGAALPAAGAIGPICAGPLYARGGACNYCAGAPLVRARLVLGVRAGARCGDCEPAPHAPLAPARAWLDALLAGDDQT
ncbi:uncharacterized protein LOC114363509 [Ostrinia furnacalis]|uniref:uncharacterized protein LOC114363509 n=1 Tax=Ostrinia furnacalis TaxID=93504 RepID=UPI00103EA3E6|nr:uncharacterized protein LOC114363509 [Ostrinia furnacalis]